MFKVNHYYHIIHKDFAHVNPIKCIIKIIDTGNLTNSKVVWRMKVVKIFESYKGCTCHEGLITLWYEDWCDILTEYEYMPTESELLAIAL